MKFAVIATLAASTLAADIDVSELKSCAEEVCADETVCCEYDAITEQIDAGKDMCFAKETETDDKISVVKYMLDAEESAGDAVEVKVTCAAADSAASTKVGFAAAAMAAAYYMV